MNLAIRVNKRQLLLLVLIIVSLLVTALIVIHAAMPGLWHVVAASKPNFPYHRP